MVEDYDLKPVRSVYDHPLKALLHVPHVNDVVEQKLTFVEKDFYQMVVPQLTLNRYFSLMVRRTRSVLVLVYTILIVPSPAFIDFGGFDSDKGSPSRYAPYPDRHM
jgi:hypothetical protein